MSVNRLEEQARELVGTERNCGSVGWQAKAVTVLAGLADAVEQLQAERDNVLDGAGTLTRELTDSFGERNEARARVAELEAENETLRRESGGLTADGRTVPELEARVAALEAIAIQAPCHCIGSGSTHDVPRVTYRCPRCSLLDSVPSTGQETT